MSNDEFRNDEWRSHCGPKGTALAAVDSLSLDNRIDLNHRDDEMVLAQGFTIPKRFKLQLFGSSSGWGEDDPIWSARLIRDGWNLVSYPTGTKDEHGAKVMLEYSRRLCGANQILNGRSDIQLKWPCLVLMNAMVPGTSSST